MVTGSKHTISINKNKIDLALNSLEANVKNCNLTTVRSVSRVIVAIEQAINEDSLYAEEINSYEERTKLAIENFEKKCSCLIK